MAEGERETVRVRLGDIAPNPKRSLTKNPYREDSINQLVSQIKQNGLNLKFLCRRKDGRLELAFGHHRLEAAKRLWGEDHELEVSVGDLTDAEMIQQMAGDNDPAYNCTMQVMDDMVRAAREHLEKHPEEQKKALTSEDTEDKHERVRLGAPMIAAFLGKKKKLNLVRLSLERTNAIDDGVVHPDAIYLMPNPHLADIFIGVMKEYCSEGLDKKYHVPIAKHIIERGARTESEMGLCVYRACRFLEKEGLCFFDPDFDYNTKFKKLAAKMHQLSWQLFYLPTKINEFFSDDKKISDAVRLKDLSNFRANLIELGKHLASIREHIESKVPADVWTQKEVKPTVKEYKALLARTERLQGKNVILHPGELRKYFGLHKRKEVPWGRYYLRQVKKMIKQGKFYYIEERVKEAAKKEQAGKKTG